MYKRSLQLTLSACGALSALSIFAIVLLISANVLLRKFAQTNIPWAIEVSEYALYASTFLAAPWVLAKNAHIRVDVLTGRLTENTKARIESWVNALGLCVSLVFFYYGLQATWAAYSGNAIIFKELILPEWPLLAIIPFSACLLMLEFLGRFITHDPEEVG